MITVTSRAATELQELLDAQGPLPGQGIKLIPTPTGGIGMTVAAPDEGDEVVPSTEAPLLIVDASLTELLDGVVFDVEPAAVEGGRPEFRLRRPEAEG
jgi:Fe-S cluster assembly iron-binding protein IscA